MNALMQLEPRVAGDVVLEPDADFTAHGADLHYDPEITPDLCVTGTSTTFVCMNHTSVCMCP